MHEAPVVAIQAWVHVGSADESDDLAGIAHVHEHMLFKGTSKRGVGEIARSIETAGGEINAWTSYDQTVYHVVLAAQEFETGLDILADALRNSSFDAGELTRETEVILEEIRRAEDNPSKRISKSIFSLAFEKHPYGRPVIGFEKTVRSFTRDRIVDFYRRFYRPQRMTLVITGDVDETRWQSQVEKIFGDWHVANAPNVARPAEPQQTTMRVRVQQDEVQEARLALAWHIPGIHHDDTVALDVLSVVLGHGESSRLFHELRRRKQVVNDVYAYAYTPREPGLFMVGAGLRPENLEAAIGALLQHLLILQRTLVGAGEFEKAKAIILSEAAYQRETVQGEARRLGFFEVVASDYNFEMHYKKRLQSLTPEDLRRVAKTYFNENLSAVALVPKGDATTESDVRLLIKNAYTRATESRHSSHQPGPLGVVREVLSNGATLLLKREQTPIVALRALALGGLRWEQPAEQGLSNLVASLWGLGTRTRPPESLALRAAELGGNVSGFSGRNSVGMRGEFIVEKKDEGIELFCDALLNSEFLPDDFERERSLALERIRTRPDHPSSVAFDAFVAALYGNHPYGRMALGTESTVRSFQLRSVTDYARNFLMADKMVLAVVGDIDVGEMLDSLAERLGDVRGPALPTLQLPSPQARAQTIRGTLEKKQSHVLVGSLGTTVQHADRFVLAVLTGILSGQSGRLFLDLRDRQSLCYAISASNLEGMDAGHVVVHAATSPDKVERVLTGVHHHLRRLREEFVDPVELQRVQRYLVGEHAIDLQRTGARAMTIALGERLGLGYDHYTQYIEKIQAVTPEQLRAAASKYLSPTDLVEVVVGPAKL